jgi:hypothetical protein
MSRGTGTEGRDRIDSGRRPFTTLLQSNLAKLLRNQSLGNAIPLARKYLPEQVPLTPKFYVVMADAPVRRPSMISFILMYSSPPGARPGEHAL